MGDPFTSEIEYPGELMLDGPREGVLYDYVVSWYLDGIVNFTEPLRAFMLVRYAASGHAEAIAELAKQSTGHVCQHDDAVLLRTSHGGARLWLFYFDRDSSDCMVGWVANTAENLAALLTWVRETADEGFALYQPDAERPEDGTMLEITDLPECVLW